MKLISMRLLAVCLFGIVIAGCPDDSDVGTLLSIDDVDDSRADGEGGDDVSSEVDATSGDASDTGESGEARIRAMHVSPVAPPVDVYANGDGPVIEALEFASGTPYLTVPDGQYLFSITPSGAPTEDAVLNANVSLDDGAIVSMAAFGSLDDLRAIVVDDQTDGLDEENVRLEVIHAATGVSTVNILVIDGDEQSPIIEALSYGTTQGALDVPAGAYLVGVDTDDDLSADLQCDVPTLPAGEKVNVYAVLNDDEVQLVAQLPSTEAVISCVPAGSPPGDPALVRGIHLSPDAPSVDVLANGSSDPLFADLAYSQTSSFSEVPAGFYDVSVVPTGSGPDASVFDVQGVGLLEDERTTVAVYGRLEALQALYFVDVLEGLQPGLIRVRAVHTATNVGVVNLVSLGGEESQTIWEDLNEGDVGASVDLPAQAYTVGIDVGADSSVELQCSLPALPAGSIVNVYAVNTDNGVQLVVQFAESTTTLTVNCTPIGAETGQARILHLSPDAPAVDAFVDGDGPIVSNLSFADGTGYYSILVGPRTLNVAPTGVGIESSVIEATVEISADVSYSIVAFDNVASIKPLVLVDDTSAPTSGNIRIRPVHTAVGVGTVDLYAVLGTGALLPLTSDLAFGTAGAALSVPAGEYVIGIDVDGNTDVDLKCPLAVLQAGTIGNVFAVADAGGVSLVAHLGDGSTATFACEAPVKPDPADVRLLHASPFAPGVDVFANGNAIASDLSYAEGSDYLSVPAGAYDIALSPAGAGIDATVASFNVSVASGLAYSAIAYGELADLKLLALADNIAPPAAGNIRVRAVHAAVDVGPVDLYVGSSAGAAPTLLEQGLGFGIAGTEAEVPAGAYTVEFDVNSDGILDLQCVLPELSAGTIANVVAVANSGIVSLIAHLNGGATASVDCAAVVQPGQGEVRAIHLSSDAPNVDVFANGLGPVFTDVPYTATSNYVSVDEGLLKIGVAAATSPPAAQPDYVLVTDIDIAADDSVTAVVFDNHSSVSALALIDDRTAPAPGNIRLRGIHTAPGVPAVDVLVTTADGTTVPLYTGLAFGTFGDALEVAAGQYSVGLDVGGTGQADLVCDLPSLSAGFIANVFAAPDGNGVQLVVQPDTGTSLTIPCAAPPAPETSDVSVYHVAADVPAVDVAVNGTVAISNLVFPGIVGPVALASGSTDLTVLLAGTSTEVLSGSLTLAPGANYSVAAYGSATEPGLLVLENNQSPIGAGNARIRVAHTAVGVGDVDIYTLADDGAASSLLSDLAYGNAADALDVPATEYSIGIDANGDGDVDLQCDTPVLSEGTLYNLFAVNVNGAVRLLGAVEGLSAAFQITCNPVQVPTAQVSVYHVAPGVPAV
ncbi:MAG: DUF4397 domain-containing protein, partial [Myxococcota bacterium]|nr:DUF4397 domain-containing protein [Myxococcota bacterium]